MEAQRAGWPERPIDLQVPKLGEVVVRADAERVGQAVTNYLTNALKYSPPNRPVDVSVAVRVEGGEGQARLARVEVHDRGAGIPEAERLAAEWLAVDARERQWNALLKAGSFGDSKAGRGHN